VFLAKFVETGHHPHLEDVLTRLNFNDFYSTTSSSTSPRGPALAPGTPTRNKH
jgi:hypothetical protein